MRNFVLSMVALAVVACGAAPKTQSERASLEQQAHATLQSMMARDPTLQPVLANAAGYAVFPSIGKGGFIAGGAYGRGVLFQRGQRVGFVELSQASVGAQIGAQSYEELVVFRDPFDVEAVKRNQYSLGANASAVVLTAGAAAAGEARSGTTVFVVPRGGVMAELSVSGQRIGFQGG